MSFTALMLVCVGVYIIVIVAELVITRRLMHFFIELGLMLAIVFLAVMVVLTSHTRIAFGEMSSLHVLGIMLVSTACGIVARYIFDLEGRKFSWLDALKPLSLTPMVLMPLIGSLQWNGNLNTMQTVSFGFLAFQNGFFWQKMLERAKSAPQNAAPAVLRQGE
jgi:hypothetical protein